nr:reverse transcriptase [Tanacetum cinerariifolium]
MLQSYFDSSTWGEQDILKEEIKELLTRKEVMWKKRSRVQWLREGDKNTRYFHTHATSRNKRNRILKLKDEDGRWVDNEDGAIDQSLTGNDILLLEKHVIAEEVYDVLMQMALTKAPGPDGARTEWYASSPLEAEVKSLLWATH